METNKQILEDYRKKNPNADVSVQEKKLEILGNAYDHLQSVWEQLLAEKSRNRDLEEINLELKMKVRDFEEEHLSNKL
jgi:hypothetical protein